MRNAFLQKLATIDPEKIVYSDETGIDDNEVVLTGWALKGQRCYAKKNAERNTRYNIIAVYNSEGRLFAPFLFEGYCNAETYATFLERVFIPVSKPGMVLIVDNASFHKSKKITALIEQAQCRILFLPPYSPDFNPIEHLWNAVKHKTRQAAVITKDLYEAAILTLSEMCNAY